jgi:hypothetical protein
MYSWIIVGLFVCIVMHGLTDMHFARSVCKIVPGALLLGHWTVCAFQQGAIRGDEEVGPSISVAEK